MQEAVEITVKYQGYISRQLRQVEEMKRLERTPLPEGLEYSAIKGLRLEARQKLDRIRPKNLGQASRVSGGVSGGRGGADGIFEAEKRGDPRAT